MGNLKLPKKERPIGLYIFCNKHKKFYRDDSKVKCKCDTLVYKAKIHIPGTAKKCKTRILETRDFDEVCVLFKGFKKELAANSYQSNNTIGENKMPILFTDCMEDFMRFIRDEGVAHHNRAERPKKTIRHYENSILSFGFALKENNIDLEILKFTDLNERMAGYVHDYLLTTKKYKNKTFNNVMSEIKKFVRYIIEKYELKMKNPFADIKKRKVLTELKSISIEEFSNLLKLVTPENSIYTSKGKLGQNFFREWFVTAFKLGLYTGGRREEVVKLKWNGIKLTKNGDFSHIEINHFKINRANKLALGENEINIKKIPMNLDLEELLIELGYEENKNSDKYILAPEETVSREYIMHQVTLAFSHYYKLLGTGEAKQFKHLRKSYMTALYIKRGDKAYLDSGHEGMDILHSNYIDKDAVMEAKRMEFKRLGSLFNIN